MENRIANTNAKSDSVCDQANQYGKRSRTSLEIESKYNLFEIKKKERDNMERLISFTRNGESPIKREKTCLQALWPPNIY